MRCVRDLVLRRRETGGAVGDLDPHAVAVGRHLHLHLELGRGVLHRIGRQLRQHEHERVRLAVAGAGQLGEQEPPGLAHGRCGRREAARGSSRRRVRSAHYGRGLSPGKYVAVQMPVAVLLPRRRNP